MGEETLRPFSKYSATERVKLAAGGGSSEGRQAGSDLSVCAVRALPYTFAAAASFPHSAALPHIHEGARRAGDRESGAFKKTNISIDSAAAYSNAF